MAEATRLAEEDAAGGAALPETRPFRLRSAALVAEIVGAIAVVVSLVFVGLQLAQSNDLAREAAEQKQIESIGALSLVVAENPYLAELMARDQAGEALSPAERVAVTALMTHGQRTWEALYYQYRAGRVSPELWEAHRVQARAIQNTPMGKATWEGRKNWFSKSYREFRDSEGAGEGTGAVPPYAAPPAPASEPAALQPAGTPKP
jgi:hypothetical protein